MQPALDNTFVVLLQKTNPQSGKILHVDSQGKTITTFDSKYISFIVMPSDHEVVVPLYNENEIVSIDLEKSDIRKINFNFKDHPFDYDKF